MCGRCRILGVRAKKHISKEAVCVEQELAKMVVCSVLTQLNKFDFKDGTVVFF